MRLALMRYLVGDAGNIQRLYWAVRSAAESPTDDIKKQWGVFLRLYGGNSGLTRPRSAEPHFILAKELNFLEWRARWRVTNGPGKAFLSLWNQGNNHIPKYLILGQLINYDHSFLIPFLKLLTQKQPKCDELSRVGRQITQEVWQTLSKKFRTEFVSMEPPLPLNPAERTCDHYARARLRLLFGFPNNEGLNLTWQQVTRLTEEFSSLNEDWLPPNYYFKLGKAVSGKTPNEMSERQLIEKNDDAFRVLKGFMYASARAAFYYINENALPDSAVDWNRYCMLIRREKSISLQPSFFRDDFLFTIRREGV